MAEDIFEKVLSIFAGDNEPDGDRKVFLRQVLKGLTQNKYAKFYKLRTEEVDPSFAYFLYDIYKTILPMKSFVQNPSQLDRIKQITVEAYLDKNSFEIARRVRPDAVTTLLKTMNPQDLTRRLEADLQTLGAAFDKNRTAAINRCYAMISAFVKLVSFDYASFLKRFDLGFKVGDPNYVPKFAVIKAVNVVKGIESFRNNAAPINIDGDWKVVLSIFKAALNGVDLIPSDQWQNLILNIRDVQASNIMDLMIQATLKDPIWMPRPVRVDEDLAEFWIDRKRRQIEEFIGGIAINQRDAKINSLAREIFGTPDITRLSYYTLKENEIYRRSNLDGLIYAAGVNYLSAFLTDYISKEVQELCDILLIRGQWTTIALSREMSEGYHTLKGFNEEITAFDENLSESGKDGPRLKTALMRVDRDPSQFRYINSITAGINDHALELLENAYQALVIVGRHLKNLYDDLEKNPHDLIINWKELNLVSKSPLDQRMGEAYKKIDDFTQLLQIFMSM
jgi:hypothetical protein